MPDQFVNPSRPPQKYFDVVTPGQTTPSPASKPFVNNSPLQPDPMMQSAQSATPIVPSPVPTPSPFIPQPAPLPPNPVVTSEAAVPVANEQVVPTPQVRHSGHRIRMMLPLVIGIVVLFAIAIALVYTKVIHTSISF
jgi:hypothetical protein